MKNKSNFKHCIIFVCCLTLYNNQLNIRRVPGDFLPQNELISIQLLPAHLIYNIQRDSQINSNIYIPPLQLGEINSMPIFKQQQAPVSTSCYTWAAPWGLQGFLGTTRDFLSHRDQCLTAWAVFKHLSSQTLSAGYVQAAAGCMVHLYRGTECNTGKEKPTIMRISCKI